VYRDVSAMPDATVLVTAPPSKMAPMNSKKPAMMTACHSFSVLDPTEVAKLLATSLAPVSCVSGRQGGCVCVACVRQSGVSRCFFGAGPLTYLRYAVVGIAVSTAMRCSHLPSDRDAQTGCVWGRNACGTGAGECQHSPMPHAMKPAARPPHTTIQRYLRGCRGGWRGGQSESGSGRPR
jgi:hypothetical protein